MDPTPNRNLIFESQIPPRREIWYKSPGSHPEENLGWEKRKARDPEVGHQTAPPPPPQQQQQQQQQQLSQFQDLTASPQAKNKNARCIIYIAHKDSCGQFSRNVCIPPIFPTHVSIWIHSGKERLVNTRLKQWDEIAFCHAVDKLACWYVGCRAACS